MIHTNKESQRKLRNVSYLYWECLNFLRFLTRICSWNLCLWKFSITWKNGCVVVTKKNRIQSHTYRHATQKDKWDLVSNLCIVWLDNPFTWLQIPKVRKVLEESPWLLPKHLAPLLVGNHITILKNPSRDILCTAIFCSWVYLVLPIHCNLRADTLDLYP